MSLHKGEIVKNIVHKCGMKITTISTKLKISRNTLYNKFDDPNLGDAFILKLGDVIRYDFSACFPNLKEDAVSFSEISDESITYIDRNIENLIKQERKYIDLLEKHNGLLTLLAKTARGTNLPLVEQEIDGYIKNSN